MRRPAPVAMLAIVLLALPTVALADGEPDRSQLWALERLRVEEAWERSTGEGAVVAVVGTGVDLGHPDLRGSLLRDTDGEVVGTDLVDGGPPQDRHGHGTLVAGLIAAGTADGGGFAGVAPDARLMPVRVLDETGGGQGSNVEAGIRFAVDNGADVINLSLESVTADDGTGARPGAPTDAVRYAWERGVVVVAAAGNGGGSLSDYPEGSPVLLVGASDRDDRVAAFSETGRRDGVLAPGVEIVSTWCRDPGPKRCRDGTPSYGLAGGTSFAAPQVAGLAALLLADGNDHHETVRRIRAGAVDLGPPGRDAEHGAGRIDAAASLGVDGPVTSADRAAAAAEEAQGPGPASGDQQPGAVGAPAPADPAAPSEADVPSAERPSEQRDDTDEARGPDRSGGGQGASDRRDGPRPRRGSPSEPEPVALDVAPADGRGPDPPLALQLVAAGLVGAALATWSSVAGRW